MIGRRRSVLLWVVAAVLVLAGCSGIPTTSVPQVISSVDPQAGDTPAPIVSPSPGADQRQIVQGFLNAELSHDAKHTAARQYLTQPAGSAWKDTTTTVVQSVPSVSLPDGNQVTVDTAVVGTVDAAGVYHPTLNAYGASRRQFSFTLATVKGQFRISQVPQDMGVLIQQSDFIDFYRAYSLYFFDSSAKHLVADTRYYATTQQTLASNLLDQLLSGPQADLDSSLQTEFSDRIAAKQSTVTLGSPAVVQLPGVSQLDPSTITRIAAQLTWTLSQARANADRFSISDGTRILQVNGSSTFTRADFEQYDTTPDQAVPLYYVAVPGGALIQRTDSGISTVKSVSVPHIASAAVGLGETSAMVAAVSVGTATSASTLRVGTLPGAPTTVRTLPAGTVSRPEWRPRSSTVLIGVGSSLLRSVQGGALQTVKLNLEAPGGLTAVKAVRVSPDGVRVALVLTVSGLTQVWSGALVDGVAAGGVTVSIDNLHPVTPAKWQIADVGWYENDTVMAIGTIDGSPGIWTVQVDGSQPKSITTSGLPGGGLDALACLPGGSVPVVAVQAPAPSATTTLWELGVGSWETLGPGTVAGSAPAYRS